MIALWEAALWGAFGGVAVELIELLGAVKRTKRPPWRVAGEAGPTALALSVLIRLVLGIGLALAMVRMGQVSGAVGALAAGVAAPLVLEQLGRQFGAATEEPFDPPRELSGAAVGGAERPDAEPFAGDGGLAGPDRDLPDPQDGGPTNGEQLSGSRRPWVAWSAGVCSERRERQAEVSGSRRPPVVSDLRSVWSAVVRSTPAFGGRMYP